MDIKNLLTEITGPAKATRVSPLIAKNKPLIKQLISTPVEVDDSAVVDADEAELHSSEQEIADDLAKEATATVIEPASDSDDKEDTGSKKTALGFDVTGKPIRSVLFSHALMKQAADVGLRSAKEVVWVKFNPDVALKLIVAANKAIKETLERKEITPEARSVLQTLSVPTDETFVKQLQTSLAKLLVIYSSWYYDTVVIGGEGKLGSGSTLQLRRDAAIPFPMTSLVGMTKKHLKYPTDQMRSFLKAFFQDLPEVFQARIVAAPDHTGVVSKTLKYYTKSAVREAILSIEKPVLQEAISSSINLSDNIEELLDISSEKSLMRAIMKGIVQIANPHNPMSFQEFETFVIENFFSERDERELSRKIGATAPMEFTGDNGEKRERENAANAEMSGDKHSLDYSSIEGISGGVEDVNSIREADPDAVKDADLTTLDSGGVWKGINLFHEIDNGNFSALFITLLKQKYIEKGLDLVTTPETPGNSGIIEPSVEQSLFEWLNRLEAPATKSTSVEGEQYSYNEALIDFINIFSDQLKDATGSSLPADFSGSLSEDKQAELVEALSMFGRKYKIPSLQLVANRSKSQQSANPEFYAATTILGGNTRKKLRELLKFDFISLVEKEIGEDNEASLGAKQNTITSVEAIKNLQVSPAIKYLAILKLLYKFNSDHGWKILGRAIQYTKDDKELYAPIHNLVKGIVSGSDERNLNPANRRRFNDLELFGISLDSTYPTAETILFSPIDAIEHWITDIADTHLEALGVDIPLKTLQYYRDHLLKKLETIRDLKKSGGSITEAIEPRESKQQTIESFISECLPLMDNVLMDGRRLVRFLRNFVRSLRPRAYFDPSDPLIQREKSGDFRRTQKAVSEPAQQDMDIIESRGLSKKAILSLIRGYMYNEGTENKQLFAEIFDKQEKQTLFKLMGLLNTFAINTLKRNPEIAEGDIDNFLYEIKLVTAQINNPDVKEVNLDGIKKYLKLFKPILIAGLTSVKNNQSSSVSMLLRFLASNTLGHVIGINKTDLVSDLKSDAENKEAQDATLGNKQIRPEIVPALVSNDWSAFDQAEEED